MNFSKLILTLFFFASLVVVTNAQVKAPSEIQRVVNQPKFDQQKMLDLQVDVIYLASDLLEGRETGEPGEQLAADYISSRYREIGLEPKGTEGWEQAFPFTEMVNPHATPSVKPESGIGKNVVGYLDNKAPTTIIIGAHYDHLGLGGSGSLHAGEKEVHNGADDNASGIAAMLKIALELKQSASAKKNNYLFIAFSGEEKGLFGSKYYANNPTIDLKTVNFMFNMDMVGRLNEEKVLAIAGAGTSPVWHPILNETHIADIVIKSSDSGIGPSDHTSFYLKDLPVLHFFTGQHSDYHKPGDDSHLINYEGIYEVSDLMVSIIERLNTGEKIAFTKTKDDNGDKKISKFKVTLGVMPDYVYTGEGMRIDGVLSGRVAEKAGLKNGDIVMKIGEVEVKDIYSYMDGLSLFKKGDKTKVVVKRGEEMVTKEVTF